MALLPRGARALDNQVGTAPGLVIASGRTTFVAPPGVPPELRWIWEHSLAPLLDDLLGPGGFAEETLTLDLLDDSRNAWLLRMVQDEHPDVYVKSRAKGFGASDQVRVTLAASGRDDATARALVVGAASDLRAALAAEGIGLLG
jgi:molybdopterin-biosynthesis enzyme MoeA-like protein